MRDKWVAQHPDALSLGTCPQPGWPWGEAGLGARPLGLSGRSRQAAQQEVLSAVRAGGHSRRRRKGGGAWCALLSSSQGTPTSVLAQQHPNLRS